MLLQLLFVAVAAGFREEVLWVNAPDGLQTAQRQIQEFFNSSNLKLSHLVSAVTTTHSEEAETALFKFATQERPDAITEFVNAVADHLTTMGTKGEKDGLPKCQLALVTVLELWSNIPFASTCSSPSPSLHIALERIAKLWLRLLNGYTCMHEAITYRDYGGRSKKMMLLAMAHAMDLAHLRYFDHVEVLSANDRDKSHPSDELPHLDLFESLNKLVRDQGVELMKLLERKDDEGILRWKSTRGFSQQEPPTEDQNRNLAKSFMVRERVRQLPPDQSRLLGLYDEVIIPILKRKSVAQTARKRSKARTEL